MALQAKADAVKAAISSTSTCTPAAVVTLKDLLLAEPSEAQAPNRPKSQSSGRATKTTTSRAKSRTGGDAAAQEELCARDKAALATHVINAALKALSDMTKTTTATCNLQTLRRPDAAPLSPLQPRALNRVAAAAAAAKPGPVPAVPCSSQSTGCLATIECARAAFTCLRHIKGPLRPDQTDFQLENGMSALVGKLVALGMYEQALKELRVLKRRLDGSETRSEASKSSDVAGLLRFDGGLSKDSLPTVTGFQMHLLKLVAATKKASYIEAILPHLCDSEEASPLNLLLRVAETGDEKDAAKVARQMASMSQLLLSLAPSISSQEDIVAVEPRLSPSPAAAFELQSLAFRTQLRWWKIAGHKGNIDDDLLGPFARCVRAFVRREKTADGDGSVYKTVLRSFEGLMEPIRAQKYRPSTAFASPLISLYQILASAAQNERCYDEAYRWLLEVRGSLVPGQDSSVRACSVSARLLAAALKKEELDDDTEELARDVTEGLDGSLSGTVTELNELLESLSLARRSVVGLLMNILGRDGGGSSTQSVHSVSDTLADLIKTFVLRYPRFVRRWMGSPPGKDAPQKQVLQFGQRRQIVLQSVNQMLDATLMVVKCEIQTNSEVSGWQRVDDVLQHCQSLLDTLGTSTALSAAKAEDLGTYHVKISSLYFSIFSVLRKQPAAERSKEEEKWQLLSLQRSIDAVRDCTMVEKERAQNLVKLELFADLCKGAGRVGDAVKILRSVCTSMAEDGALSDVVDALTSKPPVAAWRVSESALGMSRLLRSIARLDTAWNEWTFLLPEAERAAVLEHLLHLSTLSRPLRLEDASVAALLKMCSLERHPVRRLRILLVLLHQNVGEADKGDQADDITPLVDQALEHIQESTVEASEDSSIMQYLPHLKTLYSSISTFAMETFPAQIVAEAITSWKAMVQKCETREDLLNAIDDPGRLLDHLRSLDQFAALKGENLLQLSIVELSAAVSRLHVESTEAEAEDAEILHSSQLVAQYVHIGLFPQALEVLDKTRAMVEGRDVSRRVLAEFYISEAEYFSGVGDIVTATASLEKATAICSDPYSSWAQSRSQATMMLSMTSLLHSIVTLEAGDIQDALNSIKTSVRMLSHNWAKLEASLKGKGTTNITSNTSVLSDSDISLVASANRVVVVGPRFWSLASPLLRSLLHMSSVYAHIGMFQETVYYADAAWKVAESLHSSLYKAQVSAWTGVVYRKASKMQKALGWFERAEEQIPRGVSASRVRFARQIGEFWAEMGEAERAGEMFRVAEETARLLSKYETTTTTTTKEEEEDGESRESKGSRVRTRSAAAAVSSTRSTRSTRSKSATAKSKSKAEAEAEAEAAIVDEPNISKINTSNIYQASLLAAIGISRTLGHIHQKDWAAALASLDQVKSLPKLTGVLSQEQVMTAVSLIGHSMEQMISDPVFSVMQDSTISFPAVSSHGKSRSDETSHKGTPPCEKDIAPPFAAALRRAQELLTQAHASALCSADSSMVRRISTLLQSTIIFLSATSATRPRSALYPGSATVAVDIARNVTWTREQQTLTPDVSEKNKQGIIDFSVDMAKFQRRFVDILPPKWSVISLSLSDNQHDLCITKLQAGHSPFILRLPLERANSRDADSDIFNFEHGRAELLEVIRLANETSHSARDFSAKGERGAWWAEREALDNRLRELLINVETTWLGGFKGIFSQHQRRPDLLARFQKSFQLMLDQNLPSRTTNGRGKAATSERQKQPVVLDPRILDLFIGLGDPAEPDYDFDEALNDLLYFVVDILQFHGERNAYDEIDFDAMVVQTYDALRGYHNEARAKPREAGAHSILVLEKALHAFPWESLPCMHDLAVSRVPSLAALQQLISSSSSSSSSKGMSHDPPGHYISASSGTYILNPSSDLKRTQSYFHPAFSQLPWTGIVDTAPQEADFEKALKESDVLVYFGHGSGAQYIRGKTVRRLEECRPVTFLMGCSSAALSEAGEFECYGPVWNYMMSGCRAVVGTLWDVTDRDIDRFAGVVFETWGLFERGTFGIKKKGEKGAKDGEKDGEKESLPEAVARARGACRFRWLNAAAVVVYGIPVYIRA